MREIIPGVIVDTCCSCERRRILVAVVEVGGEKKGEVQREGGGV